MKKYVTYLVRVSLAVFVGAIALSPLFTNLAENKGLDLTPQGYIPAAFSADDIPTPSATSTNTPVPGTATPTPTNTVPAPANLRITFIEYNPKGDDVANEYIEVTNLGGTAQDIQGWKITPTTIANPGPGEQVLHDPFFFPSYLLEPGNTVRVWTKIGIASPPTWYWNAITEIWLNFPPGDVARLWNSSDELVHECYYPGGGEFTTCGN
jgi:hypothetical protein